MEGQMKMLQGFQAAMNSYAANSTHLLDNWDVSQFSTAVDLGGTSSFRDLYILGANKIGA